MKRYLLLIFVLIFSLFTNSAIAKDNFKAFNKLTKYDRYFSKYSKRYFGPGFDWRYFKAQAIAESGLKENAKSPVGALGIMQIMPATYKEIIHKNPYIKGGVNQARWNIAAAIWYNRYIWDDWTAKRPFGDRLNFMLGSYNAGKGNILNAQKIAKKRSLNHNLWESIEVTLPKITGHHSKETLGYVEKINKIKKELK